MNVMLYAQPCDIAARGFFFESAEGYSREACMLCSLAADLRITQTENQNKGVHCMLAKKLLES